jgi:hypothetical protein
MNKKWITWTCFIMNEDRFSAGTKGKVVKRKTELKMGITG